MATVAARRPIMNFYTGSICPLSHRARIVLAEKGITVDIVEAGLDALPEDLLDLNPYGTLPTLVDRDLVIYDSQIIMEYLDERYPHPPLMPVDPVSRARTRMMLKRVNDDWYSVLGDIDSDDELKATKAKQAIRDGLTMIAPILDKMPYFMSDNYTLVDSSIAPILWRLPLYEIELPKQADSVLDYAERLFKRTSFIESLTEAEEEIRG